MSRISLKLLAVVFVLLVSPLHASSSGPPRRGANTSPETSSRVLGSLRTPLSEEAFFELVNGGVSYGYLVGSAQAGTQAMVVTIDLTLPGIDTATAADGSILDPFFDRYFDGPTAADAEPPAGTAIDPGGSSATDRDSAVDDADNPGAGATTPDGGIDVDEDWYSFTLDQGSIPAVNVHTSDEFDTEIWLYDQESGALTIGEDVEGAGVFSLRGPASVCEAAPDTPLCSETGRVFRSGIELLNQCGELQSPVCDQLLDTTIVDGAGTYFIVVDGFGGATDGGFYSLQISESTLDLCRADEPDAACGALQGLTGAVADFVGVCDGNSSDLCSGYEFPATPMPTLEVMPNVWVDEATPAVDTSSTTAASGGPRTVRVTPGNDPGHFTLRETGDGSGVFEVVGQELYTFRVTDAGYMNAIFNALPPGSVLDAGGYRVRRAPDGETLLLRHDDGSMFTYPRSTMAPDDYLAPLTADISDPNKTVLTGPNGIRVVIPSPHVEHVDINARPDAIATDPNDIVATENGNGPPIAALISSTGGSTGEVFDIQLVNLGKTAVITGDAIFELLTDEESTAARNAMERLMAATNNVSTAPGEAYCVEQDKAVPTTGELFRLADTGKQRQFAFARQVLSGARAAEAAGVLNPDSDPAAYVQSTRQWAIWTAEKSYDKEGFGESFVEHTRKTLEANGTEWNDQVEGIVRDLVDNRWGDVQKVLELAGIASGGSADDRTATVPPAAAGLGLAAVALLAMRRRPA